MTAGDDDDKDQLKHDVDDNDDDVLAVEVVNDDTDGSSIFAFLLLRVPHAVPLLLILLLLL